MMKYLTNISVILTFLTGLISSCSAENQMGAQIEHEQKAESEILSATTFEDQPQEELVKAVMNDQYGDTFDEELGCWLLGEEDDDYCIFPLKIEKVQTKSGQRLYIFITSKYPTGGHATPGFVSAYGLEKDTNHPNWKYFATMKEYYAGSWGVLGGCCTDLTFVKLSNNDDYGWLFTSGGMWYGIVIGTYNLLVPKQGVFVNSIKLMGMSEEDQEHYNKVEFQKSSEAKGFFPILVRKMKYKSDVEISNRIIEFDEKNFVYGE